MHCHKAQEWMSLKLDGQLSTGDERTLEAHLDGCVACAATWEQWLEIASLFEGAPMVQPPEDLTARVLARVHDKPRVQPFAGSVLAMVAGFGLLALLALWPLVGTCSAALAHLQAPGSLGIASSALASLLDVARALTEAARLLLWAIVTPRSAAAAGGYALLAVVAVAAWLRVVVFRPAPVQARPHLGR